MSVQLLSSRAVIGMFYERLSVSAGLSWVDPLSAYFTSDQELETYPWIGQVPVMREWIGGRQAKGFLDNKLEIRNLHFEATIEILLRDLRRDKTGQVRARIGELADRSQTHWASLIGTLMVNGESSVCYDGQYFFDTDHAEGDSGAQSNDLSIDISALPVTNHGSTTAPSVGEMKLCIQQAIEAIYGFKDDRGEPVNELASNFLVMVPTTLIGVAQSAVVSPMIDAGETNSLAAQRDFNITVRSTPRVNASWTSKFGVFCTDGTQKPFIRQEETPVSIKAKAENSEFEFDNDAHQYGIDTWRNAAYGDWKKACLVTMT